MGWLALLGGRQGGGRAGWDGGPGSRRGMDLQSKECSGVNMVV